MADIRKVTEKFYVAPQLNAEDFAELPGAGIAFVVNNRPDGEVAGQLPDAEARAAAEAAGLGYSYAPFIGPPPPEAMEALKAALAATDKAVLAYCRTGTRSITGWAVLQARSKSMSVDEIVEALDAAGYDILGMKDLLRQLANE